jgi:hypothetical protein
VNTVLHALYWFVAGGLLGLGVIAILSIGAPLIVLSLILIVVGAFRVGARGLWGSLLGCGLVPLTISYRFLVASSMPGTKNERQHIGSKAAGERQHEEQ